LWEAIPNVEGDLEDRRGEFWRLFTKEEEEILSKALPLTTIGPCCSF